MKRLLREPLVHFLLLGAGLFVAFGLVGERTGSEPGRIVVTQGQIESLAIGFARTWQRPPTDSGAGGFDPGLYSRGSLLPRGDWHSGWTRTTSSSAAVFDRKWNSSPMTSLPKSSPPMRS